MALFPWLGSSEPPEPAEPTYTASTRRRYQAALERGDQTTAKTIEGKVNTSGSPDEKAQLREDFQNGYHRPARRGRS